MAYKTINESFWTDPKVKALSPNNKLLFLYLITNPHTHYSGIYYMPILLIEDETGLKKDTIRMGLESLVNGGIIQIDDKLNIIWVVKMAEYQIQQGNKQNIIKGIGSHLKTLHNSILIKGFLGMYKNLEIEYLIPSEWDGHGITIPSVTVTVTDSVTDSVKRSNGKKKVKTSMPDNFGVSDRVKAWAEKKGFGQLEEHLEYFKMKCASNGYQYIDWDDAFMGVIRDDWAKLRMAQPKERPRI